MSDNDTITITVTDNPEQDLDLSGFKLDDNWYYNDSIVAIPAINWDSDTISDPIITVGTSTLTESKLQKLSALLDIIEDDPEWAERLQTQLAFNKLRNTG